MPKNEKKTNHVVISMVEWGEDVGLIMEDDLESFLDSVVDNWKLPTLRDFQESIYLSVPGFKEDADYWAYNENGKLIYVTIRIEGAYKTWPNNMPCRVRLVKRTLEKKVVPQEK
ncbi:MAG: hypothetical protein WCO09_03095 [bacterium]